jgi:hypothetical protein
LDYEDLKKEINAIAEIAASVPEDFQSRCFEVLLENLLSQQRTAVAPAVAPAVQHDSDTPRNAVTPLGMPGRAKVFMRKTKLEIEEISEVLTIEAGEVHFLSEPHPSSMAQAQLEWGLLLALKSLLEGGDLAIDPEALRSLLQEKGVYDKKNFTAHLANKLDSIVSGPLESQGDPRRLNGEGERQLGALIKQLASG